MRNSKYSREFRDSTVQSVINGDKSATQIATDLDINSKLANSGYKADLPRKASIS